MAIYYTQILNATNKKILTGDYSATGSALKTDTSLLKDLRLAIGKVPHSNDNKVFSLADQAGRHLYYFQQKDGALACAIADRKTAPAEISQYFGKVFADYFEACGDVGEAHYDFDDAIRSVSDEFNRRSKLAKGVEELEEAHSVLVENLGTLVNRGENLNNLESLADKVNLETREMSRRVSQMKRRAQMEQYKIYAVAALVLILLLYFFVF